MKSRVVHGWMMVGQSNTSQDFHKALSVCKMGNVLTGQVPPPMIRSKDNASGIPKEPWDVWESMEDSPMDLTFSSPLIEARADDT